MKPPRYIAASTVAEASTILTAEEGAHVLAGGTDLVVRMRDGLVRPAALVDIERIPDLAAIDSVDGHLRIGATATIAALLESPLVRRLAPLLAEAGAQMGAVQLRNLATVGGNLASAVPSADLAPPLIALGAVARIAAVGRERTLPVEEFFVGPHRSALRRGEVLTAVGVPPPERGSGAAFVKFGRRSAQVLAVVNAAAWVRLQQGVVEEVRIALGAVAPTPLRARTAEELLRGEPPDPRRLEEAAAAAAGETKPISDMRASADFRRHLSRVLVRRALEQAVQRARSRGWDRVL
ncbi:MAG: xanthine dehydrogenase family protein subunit M [Armatimonadota bacterium]|nr:xanthine dehydrogenase family protein subunit M [Armatimonadota bacterium]MDR7426258.1 xanthine dehydrogenase family protein subunit M [Armatimonadota bacterium]MDR7463300.1 xanthine dehydrogenase family protein subunit M [Armatimonadota bacterium]MDR7468966.1 xanthine dehydrogenase family protein subunit M [Armatimonadota bacterium]MDR7474011.1 xanthine dehydrogenase family protein subunit M [Armatimonadota bacterium]